MSWLIGILTAFLVVDCLLLGLLVLIQLPKKEAGMGTAFGRGMAFGRAFNYYNHTRCFGGPVSPGNRTRGPAYGRGPAFGLGPGPWSYRHLVNANDTTQNFVRSTLSVVVAFNMK